nr:RagB/SusD family nutrient uptake outer membrane protein [uncultured Pedobacter sp.]
MKTKILIYATLTILFVGCKKDFLDEKPTEKLSPEQIAKAAEKDPSLLNGSIAGIYALMYQTGTGGTTSDDDFGQKGFDIYSDMVSSDMVLGNTIYGWYSNVAKYQSTTDFTRTDAYKPWRYYYQIVLGANTVINALGGNDVEPTDATKAVMGQARALRAYAYFYLSQLYAKGYGDGNTKILPIYKDTKVPNQPLSTTKDVYDFMIDDLTKAVDYLNGFTRSSKSQINKYVAEGLLAYVYAARGANEDLAKVVTLTDDAIANSGLRLNNANEVVAELDADGNLLNPQSGFNDVNNASWMWGTDLTLASNLDLVSWWGQVDVFTYSYAWAGDPKVIDKGLYDKIRSDDVRKKQFDPENGGLELLPMYADEGYSAGDLDYIPVNKFFAPARTFGGQRQITSDYLYMRMEEMYLLNAEAKAKLGQDGPARDRLKELLSKRITDITYVDALSGQALKDEIYLQTRIELWGEGKSYLAMKRDKATITRGSNHLFFAGQSFPYNDDKLTFPIPQAEIINNPALVGN